MAISDQTSCSADPCEFEQNATCVRPTVSKLLSLCAISFAMAVAGCAQNPAPHETAARPPQVKIASSTPVTPARRRAERTYLQARNPKPDPAPLVRKLDPALLAAQPVPDCEYKRSDLKTVDPEAWARLKTEFELECYREMEKATRTRLGLLQSSVRQLQN